MFLLKENNQYVHTVFYEALDCKVTLFLRLQD